MINRLQFFFCVDTSEIKHFAPAQFLFFHRILTDVAPAAFQKSVPAGSRTVFTVRKFFYSVNMRVYDGIDVMVLQQSPNALHILRLKIVGQYFFLCAIL